MRPVGIANGAVLDWLPLEAVEEEDDGHDEGRHQAPRHGPVQIRSGILKVLSNGNSGGVKIGINRTVRINCIAGKCHFPCPNGTITSWDGIKKYYTAAENVYAPLAIVSLRER
jgi:hypothetical protein